LHPASPLVSCHRRHCWRHRCCCCCCCCRPEAECHAVCLSIVVWLDVWFGLAEHVPSLQVIPALHRYVESNIQSSWVTLNQRTILDIVRAHLTVAASPLLGGLGVAWSCDTHIYYAETYALLERAEVRGLFSGDGAFTPKPDGRPLRVASIGGGPGCTHTYLPACLPATAHCALYTHSLPACLSACSKALCLHTHTHTHTHRA
jgi:hypothetical protein